MSGSNNLFAQAVGQLPPNMQNYVGGAAYNGMRQDQNQNPGAAGGMMQPGSMAYPGQPMGGSPPVGQAPQGQGAPNISSGGASWPGFGMGGMPGTGGQGFSQPGMSVMPPSGQSGQDFTNGFMPNGGAMPYGGGSGMVNGPLWQ